MKKAYKIILIVAILVCSCKEKNKSTSDYFFDFDEVVHYKIDIGETDLMKIKNQKVKTVKDSMLLRNAWNYIFTSISDKRAVAYLDSISLEKTVIPRAVYPQINDIFKESDLVNESGTTCEPVYRNIYVFRKKRKVSGVAKLCYSCEKSVFSGTNANTQNFGSRGEYYKLKKLLKN